MLNGLRNGGILGGALFALIILGVMSAHGIKNAEALSAATVTDAATITSQNSGHWARAWLNPAGTIAYFYDCSGNDVKIVKLNMTNGATISSNTYTPGAGGGSCAVSEVFTLSSVNYIVYVQSQGTTTITYDRVNIDSGAFTSGSGATSCTTAANASTVYVTKNKIYYIMNNNNNSSMCTSKTNLDLSSHANIGNALLNTLFYSRPNRCEVTTDGSTEAGDIAYCILPAGTSVTIAKFTNGVYSSLGTFGSVQHSGIPPEAVRVGNYVLMRASMTNSPFTETTVILNTATDTFSTIGTTDYTNWNMQSQLLTDSTRAYTPSAMFLATSSAIRPYDTSGNIEAIDMPAVTVDNSTASISWFTNSFYRPKTDVFVTGSTTTWTPRTISGNDITPTPYSERLNVPMIENQTLFLTPVFKIVCDASYGLPSGILTTGSDSDCTNWRTVPTTSDTIGRILDYERDQDLIHVPVMTAYTISLSAAAPDLYSLQTIYDGFNVDTAAFDSAGGALQFLLYGQCYTMQITEESSGNILQTGNICANDITTKTISLTGITIPPDWLGSVWSHVINRTYNNGTTNDLLTFTYAKNVVPFNASLHVYDNVFDTPSYDQWFNVTGASANVVVNVTGIYSNQTIYFDLYERSTGNSTVTLVLQDVSGAKEFTYGDEFSDIGLLFGIPAVGIFPIIVAFVFPKSIAYFGAIVTVAVIGILVVLGFYTMPVWFWGLAIPLLAFAVFMGRRSGVGG